MEDTRPIMANYELDRRRAEIADTVEEDKVIRELCHVMRCQQATLSANQPRQKIITWKLTVGTAP
jgi:hypothetical protein